jgi:hypothetical protein
MAEKEAKKKVLTVDAFPIPKIMSENDFQELCETHRIRTHEKERVRHSLDEIVTAFAEHMHRQKLQPARTSDRERIQNAQKLIKNVAEFLEGSGPHGLLVLPAIAPLVAPFLSAKWLSVTFPDDDFAPQPGTPPKMGRTALRFPEHGERFFIEEQTEQARHEFVRARPRKTMLALLKNSDIALGRALAQFPRGGRRSLLDRHFLIVNLAVLWSSLKKDVSTGPNSHFADFVTSVTRGIGWPERGLIAALPDAVNHWRHLG